VHRIVPRCSESFPQWQDGHQRFRRLHLLPTEPAEAVVCEAHQGLRRGAGPAGARLVECARVSRLELTRPLPPPRLGVQKSVRIAALGLLRNGQRLKLWRPRLRRDVRPSRPVSTARRRSSGGCGLSTSGRRTRHFRKRSSAARPCRVGASKVRRRVRSNTDFQNKEDTWERVANMPPENLRDPCTGFGV